jgi:hypothetical protein
VGQLERRPSGLGDEAGVAVDRRQPLHERAEHEVAAGDEGGPAQQLHGEG